MGCNPTRTFAKSSSGLLEHVYKQAGGLLFVGLFSRSPGRLKSITGAKKPLLKGLSASDRIFPSAGTVVLVSSSLVTALFQVFFGLVSLRWCSVSAGREDRASRGQNLFIALCRNACTPDQKSFRSGDVFKQQMQCSISRRCFVCLQETTW